MEKKITTIKQIAFAGKWIEFWVDEDVKIDSDGMPDRSFDLCSKQGYYHQAVEDAGLYSYIENNGAKDLRLRWEKRGMNYEIDCFVDNLGLPIKNGQIVSEFNIPVTWEGKVVGYSDGKNGMKFTDKEAELLLMKGQTFGISARSAGKIEGDKVVDVNPPTSYSIVGKRPTDDDEDIDPDTQTLIDMGR